ncbi:MAG: ketoacyl-ACP synthase III [Bacteroidia bacterium]|jgi:3-oxoacyl-[acyl-carrier-protein] synthase-3|nr:ketoacyl-ACP synthase III [Bacteroidia bacterium]
MAVFTTNHVRISGISAAVPSRTESNLDYDYISEAERKLLVKTTGILNRHIAAEGQTVTDLGEIAGNKLIDHLGWNRNEVDLLVLVTQSRDYFLPSSAVLLQERLKLSHNCAAFDIGLGCSGYVYAMSTAMAMMQNGGLRKAIVIAGDISSYGTSRTDKSTYPLFGDAVTATALEYDTAALPVHFNLQSDGSGAEAIIIHDGSLRHPPTPESYILHEHEPGIVRARRHLWLNGLDVFSFSVREAPANIMQLCAQSSVPLEKHDWLVMHQANMLMNETIRKKLKFLPEKTPYSLNDFGNTSSASIPLTIVTKCSEAATAPQRWMLAGFGVGLSWGSMSISTHGFVCMPVIEV